MIPLVFDQLWDDDSNFAIRVLCTQIKDVIDYWREDIPKRGTEFNQFRDRKSRGGLGKVTAVQDEELNTTTYTYDAASQLTQVQDALHQITTYGYDLAGNKTSQTDANTPGHTTTYVFDVLNRRTSRTLPAGQAESFTYDFEKNMTTHVDFTKFT